MGVEDLRGQGQISLVEFLMAGFDEGLALLGDPERLRQEVQAATATGNYSQAIVLLHLLETLQGSSEEPSRQLQKAKEGAVKTLASLGIGPILLTVEEMLARLQGEPAVEAEGAPTQVEEVVVGRAVEIEAAEPTMTPEQRALIELIETDSGGNKFRHITRASILKVVAAAEGQDGGEAVTDKRFELLRQEVGRQLLDDRSSDIETIGGLTNRYLTDIQERGTESPYFIRGVFFKQLRMRWRNLPVGVFVTRVFQRELHKTTALVTAFPALFNCSPEDLLGAEMVLCRLRQEDVLEKVQAELLEGQQLGWLVEGALSFPGNVVEALELSCQRAFQSRGSKTLEMGEQERVKKFVSQAILALSKYWARAKDGPEEPLDFTVVRGRFAGWEALYYLIGKTGGDAYKAQRLTDLLFPGIEVTTDPQGWVLGAGQQR
jgi:hypothetical protein